MPPYHRKNHGLPTISVAHNETHGLAPPHRSRLYSEIPSFQQHQQRRTPYPSYEHPLPPPPYLPQAGNVRPPPAFRPINAPAHHAQPQGPPPISRSVPRSVPTEPRETISDTSTRSDRILAKLRTYSSNHALPSHTPSPPAPLQHLTWSQISALEANLLVSVIATLSKLDEATKTLFSKTLSNFSNPAHLQLHSDPDPNAYIHALVQRLRAAERKFLGVMHSAYVCCETMNEVRDGRWMDRTQGRNQGVRVLSLVVQALERVVGMEKVMFGIDGLIGKSEKDWERWVKMVERYVNAVVGVMESAKVAVEREKERWREFVGVANWTN